MPVVAQTLAKIRLISFESPHLISLTANGTSDKGGREIPVVVPSIAELAMLGRAIRNRDQLAPPQPIQLGKSTHSPLDKDAFYARMKQLEITLQQPLALAMKVQQFKNHRSSKPKPHILIFWIDT